MRLVNLTGGQACREGCLVDVMELHPDGEHWLFTMTDDVEGGGEKELFALPTANLGRAGLRSAGVVMAMGMSARLLQAGSKLKAGAVRQLRLTMTRIAKGETGTLLSQWRRHASTDLLRGRISYGGGS